MGMDGDLASIYGNIHNEIHSGWTEEGRLPREPQSGRIENMRKKYSQDSGEPGRGGVCEFYILPEYREGGGALHLAGRRIRVSASRLR